MLLCNSCVVNWEFDCPKKPLLFGARQILWQMTNDTTTTTTFKTFVTKGKFIQILASSAPPLCLFLPIISPPSPAIGPMFGPLKVRSFWALCFSCSFSYFLTPSMYALLFRLQEYGGRGWKSSCDETPNVKVWYYLFGHFDPSSSNVHNLSMSLS